VLNTTLVRNQQGAKNQAHRNANDDRAMARAWALFPGDCGLCLRTGALIDHASRTALSIRLQIRFPDHLCKDRLVL